MNRREFMDALERQLEDLSLDDRIDALQFYEDYFEDAGRDREQDVIRELGSPQAVAETIKRDLGMIVEGSSRETGESENAYRDYRSRYQSGAGSSRRDGSTYGREEQAYGGGGSRGNDGGYGNYGNNGNDHGGSGSSGYEREPRRAGAGKKLILVLLILTLPLTAGPILGIAGTILGLIVGVFALAFGLYAGGVGCLIGGIALLVMGAFAAASMVIGIGLILFAFALFVTWLCSITCRVIIPTIIGGVRTIFRNLFGGGEAVA